MMQSEQVITCLEQEIHLVIFDLATFRIELGIFDEMHSLYQLKNQVAGFWDLFSDQYFQS